VSATVNQSVVRKNKWVHQLIVEDVKLNFKVDTGAEVNVLPSNIFKKLNCQFKLEPTNIVLEAYGGQK